MIYVIHNGYLYRFRNKDYAKVKADLKSGIGVMTAITNHNPVLLGPVEVLS